jgi:membrane protein CcdC involved in cytochrome C biogenesis
MNEILARLLPLMIPLVVIALVMRRAVRGRKVRVERLWIAPSIALIGAGVLLYFQPPTDTLSQAVYAGVIVVGGALGWYRGAFTRLSVDAETHEVTSKASAAGVALILGAFVIRSGVRAFMGEQSSALHVSAALVTDAFVLFAVAMVIVQRVEIWLRCTRLLKKAGADKAAKNAVDGAEKDPL